MTPQKILIVKPSSLGDVATALPLAVDLKRAYPKAKIDWLIHPGLRDLVAGHRAISNTIDFDREGLKSWWYKPKTMAALRRLLKQLRDAQYDLVIDAQGLLRSGLFTWFTRAPRRIGFANAREGAPWCYTDKVTIPAEPYVSVVRMRMLLQPLAIHHTTFAYADVPIHPAALRTAEKYLGPVATPIVIIPGARWETKRWPIARYIELAQLLQDQGHMLLILGAPNEKHLCDQLVYALRPQAGDSAALAPSVLNLAGKTSLAEMVALLSRARLIIGNDSGPLHVAVALEKPVVGLYGPTDENFVGPYAQLSHVLRFNVDCHPCRNKECDHHSCMNALTTRQVWEKVQKVLAEPPPLEFKHPVNPR